MPEDLPADVIALLRDHVTSFEHLELILLLHRERDRTWSIDDAARRIRVDRDMIDRALTQLDAARALRIDRSAQEPRFQYEPSAPELARTIDSLAKSFENDRASLLRAMNAMAIERMRSSAIRAFAHAFVIKKKGGDDG